MNNTSVLTLRSILEGVPFTKICKTNKLISRLVLKSIITSFLAINTAYADEDNAELEVITVTAEKREGNILEIASSISAKSAEYLQDAEIYTVTELSQHIPNLHAFSWGGRRDTNIFIRGIGPGLFTDPTVGFYVDGINYSNNGSFDMELMDIQHIEVLRGPQGTLYGGNSLAGLINIVTRQPSDITEGQFSLTQDDLSRRKVKASFNTPLQDNLYFGIAVSHLNADGYIDNIYNGQDFGERSDTSARAKLRWLPSDNFEAIFILDYEKFRGDSYAMSNYDAIIAEPQQVDHNFLGKDNRDSLGAALTLKWTDGALDYTSVTSWQDWKNENSADQDATSIEGFVYNSFSDENHNQLAQEFRVSPTNSEQLDWIIGLYAYTADFDVDGLNHQDFSAIGMGEPTDNVNETKRDDSGYSAFGQLDYELTEQLTLTTGIRLEREKRKAFVNLDPSSSDPSTKLQGDKRFTEILPKIALSYKTNNSSLIYSSISKGYRAGGFDTLYPNPDNPTYDSESSINYEIGYKTKLLDNSLEFSGAVFLIDIKDQQVQQLFPTTGNIVTDNAGESSSKGFEFESRYIPADDWLLSLSGSYTDAEYQEYIGLNFLTFQEENYSGNRLPMTPKWTGNFSVQNRQTLRSNNTFGLLELFTQVDYQYVDSYSFDAPNELEQNAYSLINFKTGIEADNWQVYLWVKNLADEYYSKIEFNFGFGRTAEAAEPRSIGITVNYNF